MNERIKKVEMEKQIFNTKIPILVDNNCYVCSIYVCDWAQDSKYLEYNLILKQSKTLA